MLLLVQLLSCAVEPEAASMAPEPRIVVEAPSEPAWLPPTWYPEPEAMIEPDALEGGAPDDAPSVGSHSAFVYDLDRDEVLLAKNADERRAVASLTKLVSALALASTEPEMEQQVCITPEHWPPAPGARSRMVTDTCYPAWDVVGAALVRSDNRAAMTFPTLAGLSYEQFVDQMNEVSGELGMEDSSFVDPVGILDENLSTARDMTRAVLAVGGHPALANAASAAWWHIETLDGEREHLLSSTNRLAERRDFEILAAKTGYTDPALYCFTIALETEDGRHLAMTFLGAPTSSTRFTDVRRVLDWVEAQEPEPGDSGDSGDSG